MKILFTNTIFFQQKKGGVSRYFINLANELALLKKNFRIIAPFSKNIYLKNFIKNKISMYIPRFPINSLIKNINNIISNFFYKKYDPDIIHETYLNDYKNFNSFNDKIKVLTIFDLIHEKFKKYYQKNQFLKKKYLNLFDHYICISKNTQKDFINYFKIPKKKTSVIYCAGNHIKKIKPSKPNIILKKNLFILYVGNRNNYKNFKIIVDVFNQSSLLNNFTLVCFGGGNFSLNEIKLFKNQNKFINIQGEDSQLKFLYQNAFAHVVTSKYEGFGITLLESMELGCPVISSDAGSLKEIGGDAPLYFNPNSKIDLLKKIEVLVQNKKKYKLVVKNGYKRCLKFTWKKCAVQTFNLYKNLKIKSMIVNKSI